MNFEQMTKRELSKAIKAACKTAVEAGGGTFDEATFAKAKAKAARWMMAAYCETDWLSLVNESGINCVGVYYVECLSDPTGRNTHGRQTFGRVRR